MARIFNTDLIRLQCYEDLDASSALYEWNYPKQLLHIRLMEKRDANISEMEQLLIHDARFIIKRPLLEAILRSKEEAPVLLIDEIDRSDEEFEAFLLEVLSDFQITIPEIGTINAVKRPKVHRVVWLNPIESDPDLQSVCRGMRTALPHIDHVLPADSLQSLRRVGRVLSRLMVH